MNLCKYCSAIDFEMLRNPTVAEVQSLNTVGDYPKDRYPYKAADSDQVSPAWSLGLQSRVDESSASCPLCNAIVGLLLQQPQIREDLHADGILDPHCVAEIRNCGRVHYHEGVSWNFASDVDLFILHRLGFCWRPLDPGESTSPGRVISSHAWERLVGCLQTYDHQTTIAQEIDPFSQNRQIPDHVLFSGRRRPAMLDTHLSAHWLHDCLANHGNACSSVQESSLLQRSG